MRALVIALSSLVSVMLMQAPASAGQATPQWLIVLTLARPDLQDPKNWTDKDNAAVSAHFERLKRMTEEGKIILFGRTQDTLPNGHLVPDTTGLIILEAPDRSAAELVLKEDPAVKAGLMRGKVFSYQVALQRK